jgi:hypothetical protein
MMPAMRIVLALALVACGSHADPVIESSGSGSGLQLHATVIDAGSGSAAPIAVGSDGLPMQCAEWRGALEKLRTCKELPQDARDSLHAVYAEVSKSWGQLPVDAKRKLGPICEAGADSVLKGAKATCGW